MTPPDCKPDTCAVHDLLAADLHEIKKDVKTLLESFGGKRIERLESIVYGLCATVLMAVLVAIVALVIRK